jgi:hypothetical protein
MKSQFSFISLFSFWDVLWLCYQLIIHACSNTDLRKFDLCKFSSAFLVFQCGASGRSTLTSRRTGGPDSSPLESGRRWSSHVRTGPDRVRTRVVIIVRTRATSLLLSEAARVRTSSIHRLDGDPTEAIKTPARRILTLPHKISLLAGCEFPLFVSFWLFAFFPYSRYCVSALISSVFFKLL